MKKNRKWYFIGCFVAVYLLLFVAALHGKMQEKTKEETTTEKAGNDFYEEAVCFPVAAISEEETFAFEDSFGGERTYGGDRKHEGVDIMMQENIRGSHPVVSVSYGTIKNIGWLELGGYRVGVMTKSGVYFYYAHLYRYDESVYEGMEVVPGQILGFTGDSGYGPEGTVGQFPEHLHFGIYISGENGEEQAVNPYPTLKNLTNKMVKFFD